MKIMKVMIVLLITALALSSMLPITSKAYNFGSDISEINSGSEGKDDEIAPFARIVKAILDVVRVVAVGVAIIMLLVIGAKYMMAAPGDKADIKKHAVVYVVGALVLFASSGILAIISNFAENNLPTQ